MSKRGNHSQRLSICMSCVLILSAGCFGRRSEYRLIEAEVEDSTTVQDEAKGVQSKRWELTGYERSNA